MVETTTEDLSPLSQCEAPLPGLCGVATVCVGFNSMKKNSFRYCRSSSFCKTSPPPSLLSITLETKCNKSCPYFLPCCTHIPHYGGSGTPSLPFAFSQGIATVLYSPHSYHYLKLTSFFIVYLTMCEMHASET